METFFAGGVDPFADHGRPGADDQGLCNRADDKSDLFLLWPLRKVIICCFLQLPDIFGVVPQQPPSMNTPIFETAFISDATNSSVHVIKQSFRFPNAADPALGLKNQRRT